MFWQKKFLGIILNIGEHSYSDHGGGGGYTLVYVQNVSKFTISVFETSNIFICQSVNSPAIS